MSDAIVAALITGGLALAGVVLTVRGGYNKMQTEIQRKIEVGQAVTDTKLEELTREVRMHNNFAQKIPVLEEQLKVANHCISDLEHQIEK